MYNPLDELKEAIDATFHPDEAQQQVQLKEDIQKILKNEEVRDEVKQACLSMLLRLDLGEEAAESMWNHLLVSLVDVADLPEVETQLRDFCANLKTRSGELFPQTLAQLFRARAKLLASSLTPHIAGTSERIIDYGAGSGLIARELHELIKVKIEGFDTKPQVSPVRGDRGIPVEETAKDTIQAGGDRYGIGIIIDTLHHDKTPERIIEELTRLVTHKILMVETVLVESLFEKVDRNKNILFFKDYVLSRILAGHNMPVPGNYDTAEGWEARFDPFGWDLVESKGIAEEHPLLGNNHHLFVFERKKLDSLLPEEAKEAAGVEKDLLSTV